MFLLEHLRHFLAWAGVATFIASTSPVFAGQAEIDLLASYAGNWRGSALLIGPDEPETFTCRLSITKSREAKVFYTGRCTLVGLNLSVSGAIAFNDDAQRYEAVMTSNTAFSGLATGKISGQTITFDLKERNPGKQGGEVAIGAKIVLQEGVVTVNFDISFSESGETMKTSVPFAR